ncbi:MAG: type II secretion system F family protein [Deltaproteobacteria bacterium]|nr:type II secretion system F family protein [Deltaproteobacteria bacterium]
MVGLVILFFFVAVGIVTLVILNVLNKGLAEYEKRYLEESSNTLTEMFIFVDGRQILLITLLAAIVLGLMGLLLFNWYVAVLLLFIGFILPFSVIKKLRLRRVQQFDQQLVDALVQMSAAFRAGLSLVQACQSIAEEMPRPLSQEFQLFLKEVKLGVPLDEAFINMADRVGSENLLLVVTATNVSRKLGGNLAEMFDTISTTIRDRFQIEGRVQALTAMGKMQGWVVGAMPIAMGLVFNLMRPDLMKPMLEHPFGAGLIISVIVMESIGMLIIRKIIAIDV